MDGYGNSLACVNGADGLDGAGMDFFKKHKKKILIGAGIAAAAVGVYYLTKKSNPTPRRSLSGVSSGRKTTTRKKTTRQRKSTTPRKTTRRKGKPIYKVTLV